jgi:hypothetical protein
MSQCAPILANLTLRPLSLAPSYNPLPLYTSRIDEDTDNDVVSVAGPNPNTLGVNVCDDRRIDVNCYVPLGCRLSQLLDSQASTLLASKPLQPD